MHSHIRSSVFIATCAVILTASCSTSAQNAPQKFSVATVEVKPGMAGQLGEFIKKFRDAVEKTKGPQRWLASESMSGNSVLIFTMPFGTFADLANVAGDPLVAAYGEQEAARLLGTLQSAVASESTTIYTDRPDLSRPRPAPAGGAAGNPPVAVLYVDINVKAASVSQFESFVKKLIEATSATAPTEYWNMRQRMFGPGNTPGYRVVVQFPTWADLDKPGKSIEQRIREHFGAEEGDKLLAANADTILGVNQRLARVRSDLARPPAN
jgi:hypothetical protein